MPVVEMVVAQWGQEKYLIYLPLYVADELGLFAKRGLSVRLKFSGNDDQTFATVLAGEALVGVGDPAFAAIASERGVDAKVIATLVAGVAIWGVARDSSIGVVTSVEQLAGRRIGTFPEPSTNFTLMRRLLDSAAVLRGRVSIVQAPIGAQIALLEAGRADIAMELEPGASVAESNGYRVVYSSPRFHGPFAFTGVTTTGTVLSAHEATLRKFVESVEEAAQLCHADQARCLTAAKRVFPSLSANVVESAVKRMLAERTLPEHVRTSDAAWQAALRVRLAVGDLKQAQPTTQVVDNRLATAAEERLRSDVP